MPKGLRFEILTRSDIEAGGSAFLWPGGESVHLMAREVWDMVRTNPSLPDDCPVAAMLSSGDVRGAVITLAHHRILCDGQAIPAVWGHSLFAHEKLRAFGFGGLLVRELLPALLRRGILFAALGATPPAVKLLSTVGMTRVGLVPRYLLPLRADPIVRHFLKSRALAGVVSVPLNWGWGAWTGLRRRSLASAASKLRARECEFLEENAMPRALASDPRVRLEHTEAMVNWRVRFARSMKGVTIRVVALTDATGAPAGYFVGRVATHATVGSRKFKDVRIFRVLDLVAPGAIAAALPHVLEAARGCDVVEIISSCTETIDACKQAGFIKSNGYDLLLSRLDGLPERLLDPGAWFLNSLEAEAAYYSG